MKKHTINIFVVFLVYTLFLQLFIITQAKFVFAETIYTWTDSEGKTHYSTSKSSEDAEPAKLPPIIKKDFPVIKTKSIISCKQHGGIDCASGADKDGSVICYDGFRDATTPFQLHCTLARLKVSEITQPKSNGSFQIFVRNGTAIAAEGVEVSYTMRDDSTYLLNGPRSIEENGFAEYIFTPSLDAPFIEKEIRTAQIEVRCSNCQ